MKRWILIGLGAFAAVIVTCTVLVAVAVDEFGDTDIASCHYDRDTDMSIIITGSADYSTSGGTFSSRSRTVRGNACD